MDHQNNENHYEIISCSGVRDTLHTSYGYYHNDVTYKKKDDANCTGKISQTIRLKSYLPANDIDPGDPFIIPRSCPDGT